MTGRPTTFLQIAERSDSLEEFGLHFRDWLHALRRLSSRRAVAAAIADEPPRLSKRFHRGVVADAWLAAYAELISSKIGLAVPSWAQQRNRVSSEPWFAADDRNTALRLRALRDSPAPFKNRNLFTEAVDLPLNLHAGRPAKSAEEKRITSVIRQSRYRARQRAELARLRSMAPAA